MNQRTSTILSLFLFSSFLFFSFPSVFAVECGATPTDHCTISRNTVFTQGKYTVHNITFVRDNVLLNCNGATLTGKSDNPLPMLYVGARSGLVIQNCNFQNYYSDVISNEEVRGPGGTVFPIGYFTIKDNTFTSNNRAVAIRLTNQLPPNAVRSPLTNHLITNNTIAGDHKIGILIENASNSIITNNNITLTDDKEAGLLLVGGSKNLIDSNILNKGKFIFMRYALDTSRLNIIKQNTLEDSTSALELWEGVEQTMVDSNTFNYNDIGIFIRANNALILQNDFTASDGQDSSSGVLIDQTTNPVNNTVVVNNFYKIVTPVSDPNSLNVWNSFRIISGNAKQLGNYYSQYSKDSQCVRGVCCTDIDFDNICDNPYFFSGNNDSYAMRSSMFTSVLPPLIQPIPPITSSESDNIYLTINATGFNATLTYAVNDTRFMQTNDPTTFVWHTNFQDAGAYRVMAIVTDPFNIQSAVPVDITVLDANDDCSLYPNKIANGCTVKSSMTFPAGVYPVPHGITIGASNIFVGCNGATLLGDATIPATGITFNKVHDVSLTACTVKNYFTGINLTQSDANTVAQVNVIENRQSNIDSNGITLVDADSNTLINSNISSNGDTGIRLYNSHNNTLVGNSVFSNENIGGIILYTSSNNYIANNTVVDNENGGISFNIFFNSGPSDGNRVEGNTVSNTRQNYGMHIRRGNNNLLFHNVLSNNPRSKQVDGGLGNTGNQWSFLNEGNYYSDHSCVGNRICSNAYTFFGGSDLYPLREPDDWLYPEPYLIAPQTIQQGQTVNITVIGTQKHAGELYVIALALGNSTGIPLLENKKIYLDGDIILQLSLQIPQAFGLTNTVGNLDQNGNAEITWTPPLNLPLQNLTFYVGGVTIDFARPVFPIDGIFVPSPVTIT